ncbi:phosphoadenylyl-sulfate reductase [archaeon SCG-AAA382B04]|nr:phosphoadenylyl-sulfate reductase [archaeon SCG-AAA382B04]
MMELREKVESAKQTIQKAINNYNNVGVACSFGKDSLTTVDIAKTLDSDITVFSIMTPFFPEETFRYAHRMNKELGLETNVYMVSDNVPEPLQKSEINIELLETREFKKKSKKAKRESGGPLYRLNPDECCRLLKVEPINYAIRDLELDAWISGLRNTESATREDNSFFESRENSVKVNPILEFTEKDVINYLDKRNIQLHPWYKKEIGDKRYRSLGCAPCTEPVKEEENERDGRWSWSDKTECGIHKSNKVDGNSQNPRDKK